ncbi:MAG: alginate export family protein [Alphaproteobacteria bacterium]|nr:alginate export family protein [Alphaproteobacteria bacterium]
MLATLLLSSALAGPPPAPPAQEEASPPPVDISGVYAIWGLNQHGFLLGRDHPLDDADYVVQMLRVNAQMDRDHYGVVTRMDAAQGWWGADNQPDLGETASLDEDGAPSAGTAYNPYAMFMNKDTNYTVHFDLAYAWVEVPALPFPVRVQAGRQYYSVGHKLILDQDADGVQIIAQPTEAFGLDLMWAKLSEGQGSVQAPKGLLMSDDAPYADADLFGGRLRLAPSETFKAEVYGLHYRDNSGAGDAAYMPGGLGHLNARFAPEISVLTALGFSADSELPVAAGLSIAAEGSYLFGVDEIDNTDHAGGLIDVNDGTLRGWTGYLRLDQHLALGVPARLGATFGIGSGDEDVTSGAGNVTAVSTMGFFPLTNVWEDSVMPDVEGISPQGLGSPVSRGYREFRNTIAAQGRVGVTPVERLDLEASYTWLRATTPIQGFDAAGVPAGPSSNDIGQEVDVNLGLKVWKGFSYKALFGVFLPGDAAGLLINGGTDSLEPAWEVKQVVTATF